MCYCASQRLQAKSAVKQPHRSQQTQGAWSLINKMCQWGVIALCGITKSSCGPKIQKCDTDVCLIFTSQCNIYKRKNAIKRRYYDVFLQPPSLLMSKHTFLLLTKKNKKKKQALHRNELWRSVHRLHTIWSVWAVFSFRREPRKVTPSDKK